MSVDVQALLAQLSETERRLMAALKDARGPVPLADLARAAGFDSENAAYSAASWLQRKGLVEVAETSSRLHALTQEGEAYARDGLPEWRAYRAAKQRPAGIPLGELRASLGDDAVRVVLAWWKRAGLGDVDKSGGETTLRAAATEPAVNQERALQALHAAWTAAGRQPVTRPSGQDQAPASQALDALLARPGLTQAHDVKHRTVALSETGRAVAQDAGLAQAAVGEITADLIRSGAWRDARFQSYSVATASPRTAGAKPHPLSQIIDEVRQIFVQLGFSEIDEEYVQSAFWNMDALFIPQDHPAREMQDTFYLSRPSTVPVERDLIDRIGRVHKSGGDTGSRGWGQDLDPAESQRALLRTHTTVGTIRYLAKNPDPPVRVFSVGRVFRHETMDATHLPEFHQVEGICTEEGADFPMLLGILQEFYRRLGFPKLRWRPAFFPYTEPSMEVEVWTGGRWMELGGCGIFRSEVTRPFGVRTPVLAWGLGLERLAMMRLGRTDIRDLYVSDIEWLRNQPLVD